MFKLESKTEEVSEENLKAIATYLFNHAKEIGTLKTEIISELHPCIDEWNNKETKKFGFVWELANLMRLPGWVTQSWQLELAVASQHSDKNTFDYSIAGYFGKLQSNITIEQGTGPLQRGILIIGWNASTYDPNGWHIRIEGQYGVLYESKLGEESQGKIIINSDELGFDPLITPFRYIIYPGSSVTQ